MNSLSGRFFPIPDTQPVVSICCITYNHEKYVRDAIKGFLMQETDFPLEIIIHDDASTDSTPAIIREYADKYPDLIVPIFQTENQYSQGKRIFGTFVFPRVRGKYIALCEGDDYWTSPHKLQRQVDYMEAHPDCRICFHATAITYNDIDSSSDETIAPPPNHSVSYKNWLRYCSTNFNYIPTLSVVFRPVNKSLPEWYSQLRACGDWPLWVWLLENGGSLDFLEQNMPMGCYRRHVHGMTYTKNDLEKHTQRALDYIYDYSLVSAQVDRGVRQFFRPLQFKYHRQLVNIYLGRGNFGSARYHALRLFLYLPLGRKGHFLNALRLFVRSWIPWLYPVIVGWKKSLNSFSMFCRKT